MGAPLSPKKVAAAVPNRASIIKPMYPISSSPAVPRRPNPLASSNPLSGIPSSFNGAPRQYTLDSFQIGRKLGKGKFGKVYCVKDKATGYVCALKVMEKKELRLFKVEKQFRREVEIQSNLRFVFIIIYFLVLLELHAN